MNSSFRSPCSVLAVYPHAHYVAREVQAIARRPDGSTDWLVHIADWNLDWQAVYELATPLSLPRGTVISMRWTYDNSARNERNPHNPPRRVTAGNRASDEMSHLWVQVLPERREDLPLLQEALMRARLRKYPGDFVANANLGALLQSARPSGRGRAPSAGLPCEPGPIIRPRATTSAPRCSPRGAWPTRSRHSPRSCAHRPSTCRRTTTSGTRSWRPGARHRGDRAIRVCAGPHAAGRGGVERSWQRAGDDGTRCRGEARAGAVARAESQPTPKPTTISGSSPRRPVVSPMPKSHFERALAIDPSDADFAQALAQARAARRR